MGKANTTEIQLNPGVTDKTTSQDILNIANAIDIANKIKLNGGYILSQKLIGDLIESLRATNQKYLAQILESSKSMFNRE